MVEGAIETDGEDCQRHTKTDTLLEVASVVMMRILLMKLSNNAIIHQKKIWNKYLVTMTYQGDTKARPVPAFSWKCVFIYLRLDLNIFEGIYLSLNSVYKD